MAPPGLPEPLLIVSLVIQSRPEIAVVVHVAAAISACLDDTAEMLLARACDFRSLKLLDRIWDSSEGVEDRVEEDPRSGRSAVFVPQRGPFSLRRFLRTDPHYEQFQFRESLLKAVGGLDVSVLECLLRALADVSSLKR